MQLPKTIKKDPKCMVKYCRENRAWSPTNKDGHPFFCKKHELEDQNQIEPFYIDPYTEAKESNMEVFNG